MITKFTSDFFCNLGIAWMECQELYTVQDGLIQEWICTVTDESLAMLQTALNPPLTIEEIAGKWGWVGEPYEAYFTYF